MNNGTVYSIDIVNKNYIDKLLDVYNDYMLLHNLFGDQEYLYIAEDVMNEIRCITTI